MKTKVNVFWAQKAGNAKSEYEDAAWPRSTETLQGWDQRIAVADGATDAVYSGLWARLLVEAYGSCQMTGLTIQENLGEAAKMWEQQVRRASLPWYAEEKARAGAYAA